MGQTNVNHFQLLLLKTCCFFQLSVQQSIKQLQRWGVSYLQLAIFFYCYIKGKKKTLRILTFSSRVLTFYPNSNSFDTIWTLISRNLTLNLRCWNCSPKALQSENSVFSIRLFQSHEKTFTSQNYDFLSRILT